MSTAKWYVVHTYSGYENKVGFNIDKTIENRHLEDQILEVRVPMQDVVELKNGVQKAAQRKLFPGYVLIHMIMNDDTWYVERNTRGVTGFVGPGSKPVPLTEEEMAPLGIKKEDIVVDFEVGDTVVLLIRRMVETPSGVIRRSTHRNRASQSMLSYLAVKHRLRSVFQMSRKCNVNEVGGKSPQIPQGGTI